MPSAQKFWLYQCEWAGCGKVRSTAIFFELIYADFWSTFNGRALRVHQPLRLTTASIRISVLMPVTTYLVTRPFITVGHWIGIAALMQTKSYLFASTTRAARLSMIVGNWLSIIAHTSFVPWRASMNLAAGRSLEGRLWRPICTCTQEIDLLLAHTKAATRGFVIVGA